MAKLRRHQSQVGIRHLAADYLRFQSRVSKVTWQMMPFHDPATFDPHPLQKRNPPSPGA
jgi:hypothetical protein